MRRIPTTFRATALVPAVLALLIPTIGYAQAVTPCRDLIPLLARKIEANYAGYTLEVRGTSRDAEWTTLERSLSARAARAEADSGDACFPLLRSLTAFYRDPHLFVFQSTRVDTATIARRAAAFTERVTLTEAVIRDDLQRRRSSLDPIEGIWYDAGLRVGIVPAPRGRVGEFIAVVLTSDTSTWNAGDVRARIVRRADGHYQAELRTRSHATQQLEASLHKRVLLRFSPGMWGKAFPILPADSGLVAPVDPHRATMVTRDDGTLVVSIPSHDPTYRAALDSLLRVHGSALATAPRIVIDLRGNEGGSSLFTRGLTPYFTSNTLSASPALDAPQSMLSSPDQIAYAKRQLTYLGKSSLERLIARLEAAPGTLVPLRDSLDIVPPTTAASAKGTARIGLLVDGGTVSAAEVTLLEAMRSDRVTTFGEPTAGALDYQSVSIVGVGATGRSWLLGYPTITTRTTRETGMRGTGIAPQVRLDLRREADPIAKVIEALKR